MTHVWKWARIAGGTAVGLVVVAGTAFYVASESVIARHYPLPDSGLHASAAIERGGRLVQAYGCTDCHGKDLRGAFIDDLAITSRNLTILAKTFSDADFDHAIRHGLRPDGTSVAQEMPSDAFQFMPTADLADIIGFIRSLPARGEDVPTPSYGIAARWDFLTGNAKTDIAWFSLQRPALDLGPRLATGRQLAMTACGECHTAALAGNPGDTPDLSLVASYERADFLHFMRTGKAAGNRELRMMSHTARTRFSHFNDDELGAIYDYLAARGSKLASTPQ